MHFNPSQATFICVSYNHRQRTPPRYQSNKAYQSSPTCHCHCHSNQSSRPIVNQVPLNIKSSQDWSDMRKRSGPHDSSSSTGFSQLQNRRLRSHTFAGKVFVFLQYDIKSYSGKKGWWRKKQEISYWMKAYLLASYTTRDLDVYASNQK